MDNRFGDANRQRGGIQVRDWTTPEGMRAALANRESSGKSRPLLERINFDIIGKSLILASLGLGMAELIAPRKVQKMVGVRRGNYSRLIRLMGARELGHAFFIWLQPRPHTAVWSRVGGDALDLAALVAAFTTPKAQKKRLFGALAYILSTTALDVFTALMLGRRRAQEKSLSALTRADLNHRAGMAFNVRRSETIGAPPEALYNFWRNFENLPRFMHHLSDVTVIDSRRSHWVARAPAGTKVEWDAEMVEDRLNERISWRSLAGADVPNSGSVTFEPAPAGRGTIVRVELEYRPPAGAFGRAVAKLFGEAPSQQIAGDLRRLKQVIETGEVLRSEGTPAGYGQKMQRPARPDPEKNVERMPRFEREPRRDPQKETL